MKKLNRALVYLVLVSSLSGCVKYVYIPVYSCPEPTIPIKEQLKTSDRSLQTTDDILKAYIYDIKYLDTYSDQLLILLESYKKK